MPAIAVPPAGRCRRDRKINLWLMTDERPRRRGRGRHGRGMRGPAGFGGPAFGPGRRAGRGDMRAAILALLAEEPMHGYQIIQVISERSGGNWTPSPGSVYPTLQHLEDEGLIESIRMLWLSGLAELALGLPKHWQDRVPAKLQLLILTKSVLQMPTGKFMHYKAWSDRKNPTSWLNGLKK